RANDSVRTPHAKVGHRQGFIPYSGFFRPLLLSKQIYIPSLNLVFFSLYRFMHSDREIFFYLFEMTSLMIDATQTDVNLLYLC
uniref:hypothetical protein n=3 Tax=Legionella pneumophila TaxID=446 RepID=UPI000AE84507